MAGRAVGIAVAEESLRGARSGSRTRATIPEHGKPTSAPSTASSRHEPFNGQPSIRDNAARPASTPCAAARSTKNATRAAPFQDVGPRGVRIGCAASQLTTDRNTDY